MEFEKRRKAHYNEYEAVRLARKLIQEEHLEEEDDKEDELGGEDGGDESNKSKTAASEDGESVESVTATERSGTESGGEYVTTGADSGVVYVRPMDIDAEEHSPCPPHTTAPTQ